MLTELEAYKIIFMTTLNIFKNELYEKTAQNIINIISTHINKNILKRYNIILIFITNINRTKY